ncbi:MAG TPA: helix-turn-helix domain-containing protein [Pseudonocardiaceae bacterium]|nr:helix-turn-helix domain-containing protein [Pseudonocardiaceae bacterium]
MPDPEYVSTGEAARRLGVSHRSLLHWLERGEIEPDFVTPGGHYRWDVDRLREHLRSRRRRDE